MSSLLAKLSDWHSRHCNGEREHWYGVTIQSTDNPGWWVKIDLAGTALAAQNFERVAEAVGAGDRSRLEEILSRFLAWAGES
jgi:hypothetical protein